MTYRTITTAPTPIDALGVTTTTTRPFKPLSGLDSFLMGFAAVLLAFLIAVLALQPRLVTDPLNADTRAIETTAGYLLTYPGGAHWYTSGETVLGGVVVGAR